MNEQIFNRFTTAKVVVFCYEQNLFNHYFKSDKTTLCVELPLDVIHRMDIFKQEGTVKVHGREIYPIFFTSNESIDSKIMYFLDENFELLREFIEQDVLNGDCNLWLFADKKTTNVLCQTLKLINVPDVHVYKRNESDVPKICELRFSLSRKNQMMVPVISILNQEAICKN